MNDMGTCFHDKPRVHLSPVDDFRTINAEQIYSFPLNFATIMAKGAHFCLNTPKRTTQMMSVRYALLYAIALIEPIRQSSQRSPRRVRRRAERKRECLPSRTKSACFVSSFGSFSAKIQVKFLQCAQVFHLTRDAWNSPYHGGDEL